MQDIIVIELFCGTAGVTACFKRYGFGNAMAVDKTKHPGLLAGVISLDLTSTADQQLVLEWLEHPAVKAVFIAPPCGTASAARAIDLPGENAPRPLRTLDEPDGIQGLTANELARVSAANILYAFTVEVLERCCKLQILCMIENPRNSLFWFVTVWVESSATADLFVQDHQACMYGSKRPKFTRLAANFEQVHTISALCDGNHPHEPWGIVRTGNKRTFATALEVHYPKALCEAIVKAFTLKFIQLGLQMDPSMPSLYHAAKASTGTQAVSMKLPPTVPPYKHKYVVFMLNNVLVWPTQHAIPVEHKLIHEVTFGGVLCVNERPHYQERILHELALWKVDFSWDSFEQFAGSFDCLRILGVQWEPNEFVEKALQVEHPMDSLTTLPDELKFATQQMLKLSPGDVARRRADFFKYWSARAKELVPEEAKLKSQMDPVVANAVRQKRLKLFAEMLAFYKYPDKEVVNELVHGADLVGDVPTTRMLPVKFTPALLTVEALRSQSKLRRPHVAQDCRSSGDTEIDI